MVLSSQAQVHPYLGYSWMIAYNMYDQGKTCYSPSTVEILHQFEESWMLRTHFIVPVYHLFFLGVRNIEFLRSTECQPQERSYYSITYEDKIMTRVLLASTTLCIYRTFWHITSFKSSNQEENKIWGRKQKSLKPLSRKLKTNLILKWVVIQHILFRSRKNQYAYKSGTHDDIHGNT